MKKILITGSNGLLGQKLVKLLKSKKIYGIFALSRGEDRMFDQKGYTYYKVDITQKKELTNTIVRIKPDYIIHTAAMTNVDACELKQSLIYVNYIISI